MHANYHEVVHQMESFGVQFRDGRDLPLRIDAPRRVTYGRGGKWWYWLRTFRPNAGGDYIVGRFGSYKTGQSVKVEVDWRPLSEAEREQLRAERAAAEARAREAREREARLAAMSAAELWREAGAQGHSAYLERKQVRAEGCRYLRDGSIVVPLLRYDLPRDQALMGVQRIWGDGRKRFTAGFAKTGCALRLGRVEDAGPVLVCEGYATALTLRMASERPVFMALDAYNLAPVLAIVRALHPDNPVLVCADDDWRTRNVEGQLENVGVLRAWAAVRQVERCHVTRPVFIGPRGPKDTDFNDLHCREGLDEVRAQLAPALEVLHAA
jgi:putative DNA primase/helicase